MNPWQAITAGGLSLAFGLSLVIDAVCLGGTTFSTRRALVATAVVIASAISAPLIYWFHIRFLFFSLAAYHVLDVPRTPQLAPLVRLLRVGRSLNPLCVARVLYSRDRRVDPAEALYIARSFTWSTACGSRHLLRRVAGVHRDSRAKSGDMNRIHLTNRCSRRLPAARPHFV